MKQVTKAMFVIGMCWVVTGCSIGQQEVTKFPEQIADESKYQTKTEEGVFLGVFNEKFVELEVDGARKIYQLPSDVKKTLNGMKMETRVTFDYALTKEAEWEVRKIESLYPDRSVEKEEPKKENEEEETESKPEPEPEKKKGESINGFELEVGNDYQVKGDQLIGNNSTATIERDVNNEIQKERWRAAGELKEHGTIHEIKRNDREFTFYVETEKEYREISVRMVNGEPVRITKVIPRNDAKKTNEQMEDVLGTIR